MEAPEWGGMKTMKICPTCQQQYPNGFQYCPNDTELLVQSEDYFRRTQALEAVPVASPVENVDPVPDPVVMAGPSVVERQTERISEPPPPLPLRQPETARHTEPLRSAANPPVNPAVNPAASQSANQAIRPPANTASRQPVAPVARAGNGKPLDAPANGTAVAQKVDGPGMSFILPEQGGIFQQIGEGFGLFFKYLGRAPKEQRISEFVDNQGVLKRISAGFSLFFQYLGKRPQGANTALLLPESGSLIDRLKESGRIFVDNFGKKAPDFKPGEMGLLEDEPIYRRVGREIKLAAGDFRRDPRGFVVSVVKGEGSTRRRQQLLQAGVAMAMITYAFIFTSFLLAGLFRFRGEEKPPEEKLELQSMVMPPPIEVKVNDAPKEVPKGKGGFTGGSKPKVQQASGGGGGGREQPTPPSQGRPPQMALTPQIVPPNPEPPKIKNPSLPVASTVYGDPKALPDLKGPIGDPRGVPAPPSSGPGSGDGIGTSRGSGVGSGDGAGVGPGRGGNAGGGDMGLGGGAGPGGRGGVYNMGRDGVGRIVILYKEKAKYTEEARQNKVQGTVVLSAIFSAGGQISNIRVIRGLPDGLTEKAIEAAQKIRFKPAEKDGVPVTVRGQLEFTFNLY